MNKILLSAVAFAAIASQALAADLPSTKEAPVYVPPPPVFSWTGFYIGADIGGGWATVRDNNVDGNFNNSPAGVIGGGHIGYNYQINQFVVGLQGDFLGSGISASKYFPLTDVTVKNSQDWLASINGRLGLAFYDHALFYAIGGVAFTQTGDTVSAGPTLARLLPAGVPTTFSYPQHSWTGYDIGGGVEYAFTNNWTGRVEYRYYDFGGVNYAPAGFGPNGRQNLSDSTVTVGLTYLFGAPASAPVVAKY